MSFSIRTKILFSMLIPAILSLTLLVFIATSRFENFGKDATETVSELGRRASKDSSRTLEEQACRHLMTLAEDQAAVSEANFRDVGNDIWMLAQFAKKTWEKRETPPPLVSYSGDERPANPKDASVYVLPPGAEKKKFQRDIDLSRTLEKALLFIAGHEKNIETAYLTLETGFFRAAPWLPSDHFAPNFDPREQPGFISAGNKPPGKSFWTRFYVDSSGKHLIVTCVCPFFDDAGKRIGVVAVDLQLDALYNQIVHTQVGKKGLAFLIDREGDLIASKTLASRWGNGGDPSLVVNLLDDKQSNVPKDIQKTVRQMLDKRDQGSKSPVFHVTLDGEEMLICSADVPSPDWLLVVAIPMEEVVAPTKVVLADIAHSTQILETNIETQTRQARHIWLGIALVVLVLMLTIALILAHKISRPINQLTKGVAAIGEGNLDVHLDIKTGDEIEELAKRFNRMTGDLKSQMRTIAATTVEKERENVQLAIAKQIQMGLLPKEFLYCPYDMGVELFASLKAAQAVGGDLYDFELLDEEHLYFSLGDVSGKGVPASIFMAVGKTLLHSTIESLGDPATALTLVNRNLEENNASSMFITLFCGVLNLRTNILTYSSAGHDPPLLISGNQKKLFEFAKLPPVGVIGGLEYTNSTLQLTNDDQLLLYTDGVTEAMNHEGELFQQERFQACLLDSREATCQQQVERVTEAVREFVDGAEQSDDITMLCVRNRLDFYHL